MRHGVKKSKGKPAGKSSTKRSTKRSGKTPAKKRAMTESQLIEELSKRSGRSRSDVKDDLDLQNDVIASGLRKHGSVRTPLGTMKARNVPAKKGGQLVENPFTGEMVRSKPKPASKRVRISPSKKFRDRL